MVGKAELGGRFGPNSVAYFKPNSMADFAEIVKSCVHPREQPLTLLIKLRGEVSPKKLAVRAPRSLENSTDKSSWLEPRALNKALKLK